MLTFVLGYVAGWLAIGGFCYWRWHKDGLICAAITGGICLLPTAISLAWSLLAARRSGSEQLLAMMGGMGLRMLFVLAASLLIFVSRKPWFEEVQEREYAFWGSLLV
ncbi:MAG TPA: hypothetical protein VGZ47_01135, partial [Gemmataceae bacterium]|nr:hypothetical protein [Gemmataceae bacterium]